MNIEPSTARHRRRPVRHRALLPLLPLLLVAGLAACAATPDADEERPRWIDDPTADYPAALYVTGLGEGGTSELARNRARADLARAFEVEIRAESVDVETYGRSDATGPAGELDRRVEREIHTRTEIVLDGVDIAASWHDREDGTHYALAVVERPRAAARLRDEIRTLDRQARRQAEEAAAAEDPLRRLRALHRAITTQVRREALQRQLRVVDLGGRGIDAPVPLADLAAEYRRQAAELRFATSATGAATNVTAQALAAGVADAGFARGDGDGDGHHTLAIELELDDLGQRSDWYWYRGYLSLELRDPDGAVRAAERWTVRTSATDAATARRRAVEEAAASVPDALWRTLDAATDP